MKLIRILTLNGIQHNSRIWVKYVRSADNILADALSRFDWKRFWANAPEDINKQPDEIDPRILPPIRLWEDTHGYLSQF